jgi:DNA-binding Lrp family transcriptional regulator
MPKKPRKRNNMSNDNSQFNSSSLDDLNVSIIKEMMNDPDVKSAIIARKYNSPLSTVQRRRTKLERTILNKKYDLDISSLGWRRADLLISVSKGDCEELARKILESFKNNVVMTSLRIGNPEVNIMAHAYYHSTEELHNLVEGIKSTQGIESVDWSEIVRVVDSDNSGMINRIFRG